MTWWLVTIVPDASIKKPEPVAIARPTFEYMRIFTTAGDAWAKSFWASSDFAGWVAGGALSSARAGPTSVSETMQARRPTSKRLFRR